MNRCTFSRVHKGGLTQPLECRGEMSHGNKGYARDGSCKESVSFLFEAAAAFE